MNKKSIRALAIVLALVAVLTLAFTGCGKKDKDKETTKATASVSQTVSETASEKQAATASVHHRSNARGNLTAPANVTATHEAANHETQTTRHRPTGTTAKSVVGGNDSGCIGDEGETW